jgi:hypothetical protein
VEDITVIVHKEDRDKLPRIIQGGYTVIKPDKLIFTHEQVQAMRDNGIRFQIVEEEV